MPPKSYKRLSKDERYAILESRLLEAHLALARAEIDEAKLERVADGSDAYESAVREVADRKAHAKKRIEVSTNEAGKLRKLSKAEKAKRTKAINERVAEDTENLIKQWEAACFQHELNIAEFADNPGAKEAEEAQLRIYQEGIAVAEARLG